MALSENERRSLRGEHGDVGPGAGAANTPPRDWWRDLLAHQRLIRDRHEAIARVLVATGHPLMPQQAAILPHLADRHERTAAWLADNAAIAKNNSYNLRVLADKGYLVARPGHDDRRQRFFRLTDKGAKLADLLIATLQGGEGENHG